MAEGLQVGHRVGQRLLRHAGGPGRLGGRAELLQRLRQPRREGLQQRVGQRALDRRIHRTRQRHQPGAAVHRHLAAEQVQRLDAVRALVDHVQAVVAPVLLDGIVAGVAVAAVHLDRQAVGLQAPLARPALGDGREHLQQQRGILRSLRVAGVLLVDQAGAVQRQGQAALDIALLRQQHAAHVGVADDRHLRLAGVLAGRTDRAALRAAARVVEAGLVAGRAQHHRAEADRDARLVHHVEHALQALAGRADAVADRA